MKMPPLCVALVTALLLILGGVEDSRALGPNTIENASAQQVVDGMANKLVRGITNTATGWLEFPKQIIITWQEEGAGKGLTVGPLKGVGMTVVRTLGGIGEAATFFVSWPEFFDPYIEPPFVWQKE